MPQNRDDNARRGLPPSDRNMDECGEHDDHGGVFASYAAFLKDSWGPRGALSHIIDPNSMLEFSQEMQKNPPESAEGPPTGEDTHTIEGDSNIAPDEDPSGEMTPDEWAQYIGGGDTVALHPGESPVSSLHPTAEEEFEQRRMP